MTTLRAGHDPAIEAAKWKRHLMKNKERIRNIGLGARLQESVHGIVPDGDNDSDSDGSWAADETTDWNAPELVEFDILDGCGRPGDPPVYRARRRADGAEFVAHRMPEDHRPIHTGLTAAPQTFAIVGDAAAFRSNVLLLLRNGQVQQALRALLNHENVVSLVGETRRRAYDHGEDDRGGRDGQPRSGPTERMDSYLIWDYCDAGSLTNLFQAYPPPTAPHGGEGADGTVGGYLPESLCWHVLRSILRAITYLHDGVQFVRDGSGAYGAAQLQRFDVDWNPVLHRAIGPDTILFQHARGRETYGICKLADFGDAVVCGHLLRNGDPDVAGIAVAPAVAKSRLGPWEGVCELRARHAAASDLQTPQEERTRTLADELWSLGAVVTQMMTGEKVPDEVTCQTCGEKLVRYDEEPPAHNGVDDVGSSSGAGCHRVLYVDGDLRRRPYSMFLRDTVRSLLRLHWQWKMACTVAEPVLLDVEEHYRMWRASSAAEDEDGRGQDVGLDDDMDSRIMANK